MNYNLAYVNGRIAPADQPAVEPLDAGLLHGVGVYETLAIEKGKPIFLLEHLERMEEARKFLKIPLLRWSIAKAIDALVDESRVSSASLRITLTRGSGKGPNLLMTLRELPQPKSPVKLAVARFEKFPSDPWERIKTTCRARNILAREEAEQLGAFDALFSTADGDFVEGSVCNFYLLRKGEMMTAPLDRGILPGVTREKILMACHKLSIPFQQQLITMPVLKKAETIFISNALIGLVEVEEIIGVWKKQSGNSDTAFRALRDFYSEQVKRYLELTK